MNYKDFVNRTQVRLNPNFFAAERRVRYFFMLIGMDGVQDLAHGEVSAVGRIAYNKIVAFRTKLAVKDVAEGLRFVRHKFGKNEVYEVYENEVHVGNMSIEPAGLYSTVTLEAL